MIIVSNDLANINSPVVTVIPLTTKLNKHHLPTHVFLRGQGLDHSSIALCEQILSVDKSCLVRRMGFVFQRFDHLAIQHALMVQLDLAA